MHLQDLISSLPPESVRTTNGEMDPQIHSLAYDSRRVREGSLFFAVKGEQTDGHLYVEEAVRKGAVAIVSSRAASAADPSHLTWVQVEEIRSSMGVLAAQFYRNPSHRLQLVGITGTNGKTTTAFLTHSILERQAPALLMGTIKAKIGEWESGSERTTPEAVDIQEILDQALRSGCTAGVMEVSSHALFFHRVYQCSFPVAVFTNLSQDHLDFHKSLEEYFQAKRLLFQEHYNPGLRYAVLNCDDPFARRIEVSPSVQRVTFGFSEDNDVHPVSHETSLGGTCVNLKWFDRTLALICPLAGEHNLYNIMSAAIAASLVGASDEQIRKGMEQVGQVPGRFEKVDTRGRSTVIVDYAHTPHALENVLRLCRKLTHGRVICVFGCGGDRDQGKRPIMGAVAARDADRVIVTSDNPRFEDPVRIAQEIQKGIPEEATHWEIILDRREAIERALEVAGENDIVLLAGKGHETYQHIQGGLIPFDDREVVKEVH
ncbi:MAG: UDP-N-acetylmuramoyl-L-alanyl-D-glutamate--2,6-diaminopimelate ligase [Acidobacteriota bacterium]